MQNQLISKGILLPSGSINKDKINLIVGSMTKPFAEMVWISTNRDLETINMLNSVFVGMNTNSDRVRLFQIIQTLYGLIGLKFPYEAIIIATHYSAIEYFIFSFILDFTEIIKDYIAEDAIRNMKSRGNKKSTVAIYGI